MTEPVFAVPKSMFFPLYHAISRSKVSESHSLLVSGGSKGFSFIVVFIIALGRAGSLLLRGLSPSCGQWGLLSGCSVQASGNKASLVEKLNSHGAWA